MERKPNGLLLFVLGHVLLAAWTWRDIQQRPAQQIRGTKRLWRLLSAANTLGGSQLLAGRAPLLAVSTGLNVADRTLIARRSQGLPARSLLTGHAGIGGKCRRVPCPSATCFHPERGSLAAGCR